MGNTSSTLVTPVKVQNRLSKPKTKSNSPNNLPTGQTHKLDRLEGSQNETGNEPATQSIGSGSKSMSSVREHLRRTLCDTRASADTMPNHNSGNDCLGDIAYPVQERFMTRSRAGSTSSEGQTSPTRDSDCRTVAVGHSSCLESQDALGISRNLSKSASPKDMGSLRKALGPETAHRQSPSLPTKPDDELTKRSSTALIRRRSLAAPGIATRETTPEVLQSKGQQSEGSLSNGKVWAMEEFVPSPLAYLVNLNSTRSETPVNLEPPQIGGLELGSLRITNGTASPAPSVLSRNIPAANDSAEELQQDDAYATELEGTASVEGLAANKANHSPIQRASQGPKRRGARKHSKSLSRFDCPSKMQRCEPALGSPQGFPVEPIASPDHPRSKRTLSAQLFADDYIAEISPGLYPDGVPRPTMTVDPRSPPVEMTTTLDKEPKDGLIGTVTGKSSNSERYYSKYRHSVHSGYSSGASVAGTLDKPGAEKDYFQLRKRQYTVDAPGVMMSPFSFQEDFSESSYVQESSSKFAGQATQSTTKSPLLRESKSWRSSSFGTPSTIPPDTLTSDASETFGCKSPAMNKKLQKKRPGSTQPEVNSPKSTSGDNIPDVPKKLVDTFERRVVGSPGTNDLQHTPSAGSHTGTDGEDDSSSPSPATIEFSSLGLPKDDFKDGNQHEDDRPPTPPPHRYPPSLYSSTRYPYEAPLLDETCTTIKDFGTVADSLGASPYDIATSSHRTRPVASRTRTHPHQIGNAMSRPKSMYSMTDEAAAEFARMRSLDRMSTDSQTRSKSRPRTESAPNTNVAGRLWHLKTKYEDIPPVPRIPPHGEYKVQSRHSPPVVAHTKPLMRQDSAHSSAEDEAPPSEPRSQREWEQTHRSWSKRRKAIKEAMKLLEEQLEATKMPPKRPARNTAWPTKARERPLSEGSTRSGGSDRNVLCDRYGGGLRYGYEAGYGLSGSAGTRHKQSAASRKSAHVAYTYGVDLSDIPVFVQEMR